MRSCECEGNILVICPSQYFDIVYDGKTSSKFIRICTLISQPGSLQTPAFVVEALADEPLMHFRVVGAQRRPRVVRLLAQGDRLFTGHLNGVDLFGSMAIGVFLFFN